MEVFSFEHKDPQNVNKYIKVFGSSVNTNISLEEIDCDKWHERECNMRIRTPINHKIEIQEVWEIVVPTYIYIDKQEQGLEF